MSRATDRVAPVAEILRKDAANCDRAGQLTAVTEDAVRSTGVVKMLQPKDFGGTEDHPTEFLETVLEIASHSPSAGWVAGVVGVHPHEVALGERRMQEEIWGDDPETWIASPYAPMGRARPVEGGYVFSGRWPFSSGTDLCQWVTIGGFITEDDGETITDRRARHFVLPRSDYEIVADSWQVVGLKGTGSKDLVVRDAFVPSYRVIGTEEITEGTAAARVGGRDNPLYAMPRNVMFAGAVSAATIGICKGVLDAFVELTRTRDGRYGKSSLDPYQLAALGDAAADIDASARHLLTDVDRTYDLCAAGEPTPVSQRAEVRRNQVRATNRAVAAADRLFRVAGGVSLREDLPMERLWRDSQSAIHHIQNVQDPIMQAWGLDFFGHPIPPSIKF
ncbi:acyl-CoA dehydrogenase family protein [Nocardioides sp. cx-173]|uniref:acyl-CoA dehydrogenase family protein n=1 Tax=Nocardioides sp. cx-173 TaxID=2898796 RepID=UPI001E4ECE07|nr:acyl-CoA dehydrogenase family protein [Nocardioides sp. cx-173]MCD4526580.1 hydroxylase [Nocardioides sp. cx-173]UGB40675.1 hydroxylase [Nocardioides sp. cx-173]